MTDHNHHHAPKLDDTQPMEPVRPPLLTDAQRDVLLKADAEPSYSIKPVHVLGGDIHLCRALTLLGLLVEAPTAWFTLTAAGRAALTDTQPTPPPLLTEAQRAILAAALSRRDVMADGFPYLPTADSIGFFHHGAYGGSLSQCRDLAELGLLEAHPRNDWYFRITDAGAATLVEQPGDGLPESDPPEGGDVPSMREQLLEYNGRQARRFAEERDAALAERDLLAARLADAQTAYNLTRELADIFKEKRVDAEVENAHLRGLLDRLRRDLAEANARLATRPAEAPTEIEQRLAALEEVVLEPAPFALAESKPPRREVRTLKQNLTGVGADGQLADCLNDGWEVLHISIDAGETWTWRIVTLTREIDEDTAGDAPEVGASVEPVGTPLRGERMSWQVKPTPMAVAVDPVTGATPYALAADAEARADGLTIAHTAPLRLVLDAI